MKVQYLDLENFLTLVFKTMKKEKWVLTTILHIYFPQKLLNLTLASPLPKCWHPGINIFCNSVRITSRRGIKNNFVFLWKERLCLLYRDCAASVQHWRVRVWIQTLRLFLLAEAKDHWKVFCCIMVTSFLLYPSLIWLPWRRNMK